MSFHQEPSGFHAQCLTAVLFGFIAIGFYIVTSTYLDRADPANAKLQGLIAAAPFAITAASASVIAILIQRGTRVRPIIKALPIAMFTTYVVASVAKNAL